jgi:hypothetical protein
LTFRQESGLSYNALDAFRRPVVAMLQRSSMTLCMSLVGVMSTDATSVI